MKKIMMIWTVILVILLSISSIFAQDSGMKKMDMAAMKKSPHHLVMMSYRHNLLTFSKALRDMSNGGKLEDVDLVRNAFAEIKRSMEKMDEVHQSHMGKMSADMMAMMKPMMEKMQSENTMITEHIAELEKALQATNPNAIEVNKHAAALVLQLEKMDKTDKKMKM